MKSCIYRSEHSETHFACSNHDDLLHNGTVPKSLCEVCPYAREKTGDFFAETARLSARKRSTVKPKPCGGCPGNDLEKVPPIDMAHNGQWSVVVTTAPRPQPTIQQCINSLRKCGWEPVVFAEPGSVETDCQTIVNPEKLGVWHNWLASCRWALNHTAADIIMTVQDDSVFHPDSRTFTESVLWPSDRTGFVSLYTPKHYSRIKNVDKPNGVIRIPTRALWGACALVWPRKVLQQVINHRVAKVWSGARVRSRRHQANVTARNKAEPWRVQNSDTAIGGILNRLKLGMYFVIPSPVYHSATTSAINHGGNAGNRNCGRCADHSIPLAEQVLTSMPTDPRIASYDKLYSRGGFRYGSKQATMFRRNVINRYGMTGRVLDAPCGDGFFSQLLTQSGCDVTATDLSESGVKTAGGNAVQWDLEQSNPDWVGQYDWVMSRAISHLHREHLDTPGTRAVFANMLSYLRPGGKLAVIYWTNQSGKDSARKCHWNHTLKGLTEYLAAIGTVVDSRMLSSYAQIVVRQDNQL